MTEPSPPESFQTAGTPQQSRRPPAESVPPVPGAWADYVAAAQRLDAVRRAASSAASEQSATMQAAAEELAAVRARLAPQRARMVQDLGVPDNALTPQPADRERAAQAVAGGSAAVLAALQQARGTADAADAVLLGPGQRRAWRPWVRNLVIYGPFAVAVLIVQIVLFLVAPSGSVPTFALVCGLSLPLLAFGLGWLTIGFVYGETGAKVDRTPLIGFITCLVPVLLSCMGVGLMAFFR